MVKDTLKTKAISGIVWTSLQKYSEMTIQFFSGIILARLLTPHDYGCIGIILIFIVLAESIIDGGFGSALIQKKRPTQLDYSTIFFWNIGISCILYLCLYLASPFISHFYGIPELKEILRVQGLILFIYAFTIVQKNQLQKKLHFKIISIVSIITSLLSFIITLLMALNGFGVWSLVTQNIVIVAFPAVFFWFYVKWRPVLQFSLSSFKELFNFGFFMFLTQLLNNIGNEIQGLLIGYFYPPSTMGYYTKAYNTQRMASTSISKILVQVTFPLYAELQDDKQSLIKIIKRLTMTLAHIMFPFMFILIICAKPIFTLLYSDRWIDSVPYFQILCLAGMAFCLQSINNQSISAIGKSKTLFGYTFLKRIVGILFVVVGLLIYGIKGLLIGMVFNTWFSYIVNIALVSKYIGYKWWHQLLNLMPSMILSIFIMIVCQFISSVCGLTLYIDGLMKSVLFIILYAFLSKIFNLEAARYVGSIYSTLLNETLKKKKQVV